MSDERPYEGIRVVDLSQGIAGPYCAMLLARHGADVMKVEPLEGDWARMLGNVYGDHTAFSVPGNIGKRSIAVDLKTEEGRGVVERMLPKADVFFEGFRPGVIDRLGFSYERLREINPGLIYVSISGFGQEGPLREKPAMDPVLQAFTGFMMENKGHDGIPHRTPTIIVDMSTALFTHQAVAAALYAKARTGRGRRINASLMEGAANLQSVRLMSAYRDGPYRIAGAGSGTFQTKDGFVQMVAVKDHEFQGVCKVLGLDDYLTNPDYKTYQGRMKDAETINARVAATMLTKTSAEWNAALTEAKLQNEVLHTYEQFIAHPHTKATRAVSFITQPGSEDPWVIPNPPGLPKLEQGSPDAISPSLGQHTREIMAQLGYGVAAIDDYLERKIVKV